MKSLIILLFIAFVSSDVIPNPKVIPKGLINRNVCLGGKIENGNCKCPNNTALIGYECKPCIGGTIMLNRCICPPVKYLSGNECKIRGIIGSKPINLTRIKINPIKPHVPKKPVIYLYPKETMDISVQLNIKYSKFTTIYPKFNEKNTWNVRAKPNGDILINDKTYPYLFWEAESYAPFEHK